MYRYLLLSLCIALFACGEGEETDLEKAPENISVLPSADNKKPLTIEKNGITLTEFSDYPPFSDAELLLVSPKEKAKPGRNEFEFEVKNFPLAVKTVEEEKPGFRLEENGQHIKFLYSGHLPRIANSDMIEENLSAGENYVFAVLSRSYNLSVHAAPKGYVLSKISILDNKSKIEALSGSHMIPISPSGLYQDRYTKKILLDFYLVNTQLSEKGNYVLVTIDNSEFIIRKWVPFTIEGLAAGIHSVSFRLMDAAGKVIPGPFNDMGRIEFTLKEKDGFLN